MKRLIPLFLTFFTFFGLCILLFLLLTALNLLPFISSKGKILLTFLPIDLLVGVTIYLKTSLDFALFIGILMKDNPGWKKRIAIELGTALGNALGTFAVLGVWFFFKQAPLFMVVMIFFAALILFKMAQDGFDELRSYRKQPFTSGNFFLGFFQVWLHRCMILLNNFNHFFEPLVTKLLPQRKTRTLGTLSFWHLFGFAFSIPFILGLDDFAGYIPLFTILNVFSFCIGIFLGHMLLNLGLFAFPTITIKATSSRIIILLGSLAFIGIALWGVWDICIILLSLFRL